MIGHDHFITQLQRAACVDIRYTLFIIDKFAGAKHLGCRRGAGAGVLSAALHQGLRRLARRPGTADGPAGLTYFHSEKRPRTLGGCP